MSNSIQITNVKNISAAQTTKACQNADKQSASIINCSETQNNNELTSQQNKNKIYKQIEELCVEYRIDIEDAKKANLLECIAGCTSEDLVNMTEEDLKFVLNCLKFALKLDFKAFWNKRDLNDIKEIAQRANEKFVREKTGGNWLMQQVKNCLTKTNLTDELTSKGYLDKNNQTDKEAAKQALKDYFRNEILGNLSGLSDEKIAEKYENALKQFGYLLNILKDGNDKELLTSVIEELRADKRALAAKVALASSCGDELVRAKTAKGINDNTENIVTKRDALGNAPSKDDAAEIANCAFKYMTKEDIEEALEVLNKNSKEFFEKYGDKIKELKARRDRRETLNPWEKDLLLKAENAYEARYSGAITGTCQNSGLENETKAEIRTQILEGTEDAGITKEVLNQVETYAETHKDELPAETRKELSNAVEEMREQHLENQAKKEVHTSSKPDIKTTKKEQISVDNKTETKAKVPTKVNVVSRESAVQTTLTSSNQTVQKKTQKAVESKQIFVQEEQTKSDKSIKEAVKEGPSAVKEYFKKNSASKVITDVFNNLRFITSQATINKTTKLYSNLSAKRQEAILRKVSNSGLNELLHHTSDTTLINIKDETFSNFFATQQVRRAGEKAEENTLA